MRILLRRALLVQEVKLLIEFLLLLILFHFNDCLLNLLNLTGISFEESYDLIEHYVIKIYFCRWKKLVLN